MEELPFVNVNGLRVLCLGAHCDDIEIGCGATLRSIARRNNDVQINWVVFSSNPTRRAEAERGAFAFAGQAALEVNVEGFRNGYFPFVASEIKDYFELLKSRVTPDIIFTHYRQDAHQDHRQIAELTWNTFRDHMVLEYEIPKFDGDLGQPNVFIPVEDSDARFKSSTIVETFESQQGRQWFDEETFLSLMRLRGIECNAPSRYAEAFYARKLVISSPLRSFV